MKQKPPDKFQGIQRHQLYLVIIPGIAPGKSPLALALGYILYPIIANGNPVRVPAKIFDDSFK
jgi:hypothetical protein